MHCVAKALVTECAFRPVIMFAKASSVTDTRLLVYFAHILH